MPSDCPFCLESDLLYGDILAQNALCYLVTAEDPVLTVSGLIIPLQHVPTPFELTPEEWAATRELLLTAKSVFDQEKPDGYTLGWNVGEIGGQDVFHAHFHVVARFADEPLAHRGLRYAFKQETNRRPNMTNQKLYAMRAN